MKKLLSLLLCVMMVSSMLIVTTVSVGAYEFSSYLSDNFNSYTGEKNPYVSQCAANSGSISISPYSRGDGDTAVLATVSGHDHENTFEIDHKGIKIIDKPKTITLIILKREPTTGAK